MSEPCTERRNDVSDSFMTLVMKTHRPYHDALTRSPVMSSILNKSLPRQTYLLYLLRSRLDLGEIERRLQQFLVSLSEPTASSDLCIELLWRPELNRIDWTNLYRDDALRVDIESFGALEYVDTDDEAAQAKILSVHYAHYATLPPWLLVAHATMFYLAALFGGRTVAENVDAMYAGSVATTYYNFAGADVRDRLFAEMEKFYAALSVDDRILFADETIRAWQFQADLVDDKNLIFNTEK